MKHWVFLKKYFLLLGFWNNINNGRFNKFNKSKIMEIGTNLEKSSFLSPVKNISILLLIGGIGSLIMALPYLIISTFLGMLQLIIAVGLITTSFGLRKMKKWGLYGYTAIAIFALFGPIYYFLTSHGTDTIQLVSVAVEILFLVYFWRISKKFN